MALHSLAMGHPQELPCSASVKHELQLSVECCGIATGVPLSHGESCDGREADSVAAKAKAAVGQGRYLEGTC